MTLPNDMAKIYEDLGSLKATVASIDSKLEQGNKEFQASRKNQADMKDEISKVKAGGDTRSDTIDRIEATIIKLEARVDTLVALRHRLGGALFLGSMVFGALYEGGALVEKFVSYLSRMGKIP